MAGAFDYKKEYKDLYLPKEKPCLTDVPEMVFIMVDGKGNPQGEDYQAAVEILYGLSYSIKMSKKSGTQPEGYFEYVVPPLEGLWWLPDGEDSGIGIDKGKFFWISMIRQPEFVDEAAFETAKTALSKKKPNVDTSRARLEKFKEGLCVQAMHVGSYDDEPRTIEAIMRYITESGYVCDLSDTRRHHEIYLNDPRKVAPEKIMTVIRYPVAKPCD